MSSNPFNCPPPVFRSMMERHPTPVDMPALWAVRTLGPERVQYVGRPPSNSGCGDDDHPTSWSLDGHKHVTVGRLIAAARAAAKRAALIAA